MPRVNLNSSRAKSRFAWGHFEFVQGEIEIRLGRIPKSSRENFGLAYSGGCLHLAGKMCKIGCSYAYMAIFQLDNACGRCLQSSAQACSSRARPGNVARNRPQIPLNACFSALGIFSNWAVALAPSGEIMVYYVSTLDKVQVGVLYTGATWPSRRNRKRRPKLRQRRLQKPLPGRRKPRPPRCSWRMRPGC